MPSQRANPTPERLADYPISHAEITRFHHPDLDTEVHGLAAVRVLRFLRPVRVDRLLLRPVVYGRWQPDVPTHPAHLVISLLDPDTGRRQTIADVTLPPDDRIAGCDLDQSMTPSQMNARLSAVLEGPPHVIELDGIETDHLCVVCDREHPVWPNHGECNGPPHQVPFGILNGLEAWGTPLTPLPALPAYRPPLDLIRCDPVAPAGMTARRGPMSVHFEGPRFSVGFSLVRPLLVQLGWEAWDSPVPPPNRLLVSRGLAQSGPGGLSGPVYRSLVGDYGPRRWQGRVEVDGPQVRYRDLTCDLGITLDATFTVRKDGLTLELAQQTPHDLPMLEAEAWRFAWNLEAGNTAAAALPTLATGRNGQVAWPVCWATDGAGALAWEITHAEPAEPLAQVESYRNARCVTGGLVLAPPPDAAAHALTLPAGTRRATTTLRVTAFMPEIDNARQSAGARQAADALASSPGVRRHWGSIYACFRPEFGGFSNNAASVNCHVNQGPPAEIVAHTRPPQGGPDPVALGRATIGRALLDGGGYGYWRNLYLDSDPILVSAAGKLHQARPDADWSARIRPGLVAAFERILTSLDASGLVVCRDLSGNRGSHRWSSNAIDVVGFGHIDAYVNAWTYRALMNASALLGAPTASDSPDAALATRCIRAAQALRAAYTAALRNPETGWIAGWRSRDGKLHDYAFLYVNGVALAFGLLEPADARAALEGLETLRDSAGCCGRVGPMSAQMGLPCNLLPIHEHDHMLPEILGRHQPTFELYTDGGLTGGTATYYLRALEIYGLTGQARALADDLDRGLDRGYFTGGIGTGVEFRSWDGLPTGYEGTLIGSLGPVYAIAITRGLITPHNPEWWPALTGNHSM